MRVSTISTYNNKKMNSLKTVVYLSTNSVQQYTCRHHRNFNHFSDVVLRLIVFCAVKQFWNKMTKYKNQLYNTIT